MSDVVITGVGACTDLARDAEELWKRVSLGDQRRDGGVTRNGGITRNGCERNLLKRRAGFIKIPLADVPGSPPYQVIPPSRVCPTHQSSAIEYAERATIEALTRAGLWNGKELVGVDAERVGCTLSASKPLFTKDDSILPPDAMNGAVCETVGIQGERRTVVAACATGAYAAALGASWIEMGLCDVVLAGSAEPPAHPLIEAGFRRMGVMSAEGAMRPFDRDRSGFVLGHGAGVVVLESGSHAAARGAPVYGRLAGWGWGADPHSAVAFNSNGAHIARVIGQAMKRAGLTPEAIGHVNAHGTATPVNDRIETQALVKAFGRHADRLMISGTKSTTGHLLGAAGSVELVLTVQALNAQYVPPTAHLDEPDAECPLDYTPKRGHAAVFEHALSLSFGFGGPIGALIVSRTAGDGGITVEAGCP